jgi:hypothetical protein
MCDFDGDGVCDVSDINAMLETGPIAGGVAATLGVSDQFDLTGDAIIDRSDLVEWLAIAADEAGLSSPYKPGDANLDGVVDVSDFNRWNSNRFTSTLLWSDGNFNADSAVDVQDFNVWNENKFTSSDLAAVPEPSSILLILSPLLILTNLRRSVRCAAK